MAMCGTTAAEHAGGQRSAGVRPIHAVGGPLAENAPCHIAILQVCRTAGGGAWKSGRKACWRPEICQNARCPRRLRPAWPAHWQKSASYALRQQGSRPETFKVRDVPLLLGDASPDAAFCLLTIWPVVVRGERPCMACSARMMCGTGADGHAGWCHAQRPLMSTPACLDGTARCPDISCRRLKPHSSCCLAARRSRRQC
jgi:hypothetical protein